MIDAKDLRIGNLVKYADDDVVVKVWGILADLEQIMPYKDINGMEGEFWSIDSFEPIPLTEERLLQFGFDKGCNSLGLPMYKLPNHKQCVGQFADMFGLAGFEYQPPLDYVHQLQNLYYSLTGKELELNETK